ncbi:histone acetyltransferase [Plasmodium gonderi]|uniref:RNA cytidine acetyltransferase n=1 Tax=Plasmodium gonderi TaxID=77519 RepID=A0A1Y1JBK6_PLAGO|nr:histone acetyltransferase [Plasmodium gonderi]GAW79909.1 histone acetyltransferase [Plasmodium gonderi]
MKKKVDSRIKTLVENNVLLGQRTMFLVIGDQGKNIVVNFYFLLNRLSSGTHSILWCYKKKLDFSTSKKKRFREMKKKIKKGTFDTTIDNNFDAFLKSANIRFCFYNETKKVLGKTYSICVMQDFSYITPNILCRCIETVVGGGIIIFLINKLDDLKDIYNLTLNCHKKYTQSGISNVYNNYITRFFLSLNECHNAMFIDDEMNILPLNENHLHIKKLSATGSTPEEKNTNAQNSDPIHVRCEKNHKEENYGITQLCHDNNQVKSRSKLSNTLGGYLSPDTQELEQKLSFLESVCEENEKREEESRMFLHSSRFYDGKLSNKRNRSAGEEAELGKDPGEVPPSCVLLKGKEETNMYSFLNKRIMNLLRICLSIDQLNILVNMCKILRNDEEKKKNIKEILLNLLANRGRGKSATLGLLIALSIYFKYTNIILCSGNSEGMQTIYEFIDKGLELLGYKEFLHFEKVYELGKLKEIIIFKDLSNITHIKQRIRYFNILEDEIVNSELMIIDEAACIPIDILKHKIKGEITILSTTLNGYEGTGKTFIFKLLKQLKKKFVTQLTYSEFQQMKYLYFDKAFIDVSLNTPIRYSYNDKVEAWLNNFLCLNCNETYKLNHALCAPSNCQLYFVNKNVFKSFSKTSELLLKKIMTLFVTSHYKNTPNDLIMILDSQQHHLFVLISGLVDPVDISPDAVDQIDIYGVIHCAIDGIVYPQKVKKLVKLENIAELVRSSHAHQRENGVKNGSAQKNHLQNGQEKYHQNGQENISMKNEKAKKEPVHPDTAEMRERNNHMLNEFEGNLMPYLISAHFDYYFYNYIGIRIVRISIHPSIQNLNYGSNFLNKLFHYYNLYNAKGRKESVPYRENVIFYNCSVGNQGENRGQSQSGRTNESGGHIFLDDKLKKVDYIGTCFGLTKGLLIFWQKNNFIPVFLKQQRNEITGEFSILMLKHINQELKNIFTNFYLDFVRTFCNLLPYAFNKLESFVVFNLLHNNSIILSNPTQEELLLSREQGAVAKGDDQKSIINGRRSEATYKEEESEDYGCFYDNDLLKKENLFYFFHPNDICRLKRFVMESKPICDILHLMNAIANLILFRKVPIDLTFLEYTILYAVSFQKKSCQEISLEISINVNQTGAVLRKIIHRFYTFLKDVMQKEIEKQVDAQFNQKMQKKKKRAQQVEFPSDEYTEELEKNTKAIKKKHKKEKLTLMREFNFTEIPKRKQINVKTNDDTDISPEDSAIN